MRIDFQLTMEEFAEGLRSYHLLEQRRGEGTPQGLGPIAWVILAVVTVVAIVVLGGDARKDLARNFSDFPEVANHIVVATPWIFLLIFQNVFPLAAKATRGWAIAFATLLIIAAIAFAVFTGRYQSTITPVEFFISWACVGLTGFRSMQWLLSTSSVKPIWEMNSMLHAPCCLITDDDGYTTETALWQARFKWEAMHAWSETPNTFILWVGKGTFQVIPKRGFENDDAISAFRELLAAATRRRQSAFPVIVRSDDETKSSE